MQARQVRGAAGLGPVAELGFIRRVGLEYCGEVADQAGEAGHLGQAEVGLPSSACWLSVRAPGRVTSIRVTRPGGQVRPAGFDLALG
jgi:hypothetical protein